LRSFIIGRALYSNPSKIVVKLVLPYMLSTERTSRVFTSFCVCGGGHTNKKRPDARGLDSSAAQRFPFREVQRGLGLERFRFTPFRDVQRGLNKKHPDVRGHDSSWQSAAARPKSTET